MTTPQPLLFRRKTQDLLTEIEKELRDSEHLRWQSQKEGPGQAMVNLFGRFADVIVTRLNQVPRQHFLAFLGEGGIDQLPPRAATTQLLFMPENDARPAIPVPAGTQVATRPASQQLEIIFETSQDVQVIPTELVRCIAADQRTSSDQTNKVKGIEAGSFFIFQGEKVRERVLFLREDDLFTFPDPAVREHATVTLHFELDSKVKTAGKWQLIWLYWDGQAWAPLADVGAEVVDGTGGLLHSGDVRLTRLPEIAAVEVHKVKGLWIACQLVPVSEQVALPQILRIDISREFNVPDREVVPQVLTATQAGVAFAQVKPEDAFYPFGQFPALLDGLYIRADEALTKSGATVELRFEGDGLPPKLEDTSVLETLTVLWEYFSKDGWTRLGTSRWGCPSMAFADRNDPLVKNISLRLGTGPADRQVEIELPRDYASDLPPPGFPDGTVYREGINGRVLFITDLPAACEELPDQILERGRSYASERLDFRDTTCAFTARGAGVVAFRVPAAASSDPPFALAKVNEQAGYWVRARIVEGAYNVPQPGPSGLLQKLLLGKILPPPPLAVPPLVRHFHVFYVNYKPPIEGPRAIQAYLGKTDGGRPIPAVILAQAGNAGTVAGQAFDPFSRSAEEAALYLGFSPLGTDPTSPRVAFPANTWVELYVGVEEVYDERTGSDLRWEYWDGKGWQILDVVDETLGLRRSGTVGFFGPSDHQPSAEFFGPPSLVPVRRAGEAPDQQPDVSSDRAAQSRSIHWLRVIPAYAGTAARLTAIRLNTAPAVNGESISDELLGSSNGQKNQVFTLSRPPILPDIQVEVQEPVEESEGSGGSDGSDKTWKAWQRVPTLLACDATSRCYVLDPTSGSVTFGDNKRGMIPPAGQNNIRARRYRTHNGEAGNLAVGAVSVLRNPKDALNEIRRVANDEPAAGGAALEETAQVELRGPYSLKNRGRAITCEDFEWLAREVAGVRHVYCLPTRKVDGTSEPGWVTAVVVPEPTNALTDLDSRPIPAQSLLRQVREYLEARGLTNLARPGGRSVITAVSSAAFSPDGKSIVTASSDGTARVWDAATGQELGQRRLTGHTGAVTSAVFSPDGKSVVTASSDGTARVWDAATGQELRRLTSHATALDPDKIQVTGPGFVEVQVIAEVVPKNPTQADSVRKGILEQLAAFLNPLDGGPDRQGWEPGRDVYISEVKAEIESVPGVDHVRHAHLLTPSRQQQSLTLEKGTMLKVAMPKGSQVSTFDERIKAVLADALLPDPDVPLQDIPVRDIPVVGFNDGDMAMIVGLQGPALPAMRRVSVGVDVQPSVQPLDRTKIVFDQPVDFGDAGDFEKWWSELGDAAALISADGRVRATIEKKVPRPLTKTDDTGRVHLLGVWVSGFVAGEPVCITHVEHPDRRVEFLRVTGISNSEKLIRVYVPADHLVLSGSHDIRMALEETHARQAP